MTADEINQEQIEKAKKAGKEYQGREPEEVKPEEVKPAAKPAPSEPKSAKEEVETDK